MKHIRDVPEHPSKQEQFGDRMNLEITQKHHGRGREKIRKGRQWEEIGSAPACWQGTAQNSQDARHRGSLLPWFIFHLIKTLCQPAQEEAAKSGPVSEDTPQILNVSGLGNLAAFQCVQQ